MAERVRCAGCGYLSIRGPGGLVEVGEVMRERWDAEFDVYLGPGLKCTHWPVCAAQAADLTQESGYNGKDDLRNEDVLATIRKDRDCGGFTKWWPGLSPKEHRQMSFEAELRKIRADEAAEQRNWQERQAELQRAFQHSLSVRMLLLSTLVSSLIGVISFLVGQYFREPAKPQQIEITIPGLADRPPPAGQEKK